MVDGFAGADATFQQMARDLIKSGKAKDLGAAKEQLRANALFKQYDGVLFEDNSWGYNIDHDNPQYVAFNPNQIKSATVNNGNFDEKSDDIRFHAVQSEALEAVNNRFNEELETLTPENADSKVFNLGSPSNIALSTGIKNKSYKLYGNKLIAKMKKHGFKASDIKDLPKALSNPIAIFKGNVPGSFSILTELNIKGNNVLTTVNVGKDKDVDFNIISSTYGKSDSGVVGWINKGKLLYTDKEKTLNYLGAPAPIAGSANNSELDSATKVIQNFENPKLSGEKMQDSGESETIRFHAAGEEGTVNRDVSETEKNRNELDEELTTFLFKLRENYEDRYLAVKEFLDVLRKEGTEIAEYNDYYFQATHESGKKDALIEYYDSKFQRPLNKAVSNLKKAGFPYREIENYVILKHGLERNIWMRDDAVNEYKKKHPSASPEQITSFENGLPTDFAGVKAVEEETGVSAKDFISSFELRAGDELTSELWKRIRAATSFSVQKMKEGGLLNSKQAESLLSRYKYYVPLRGHDKKTAEDRWDYSPDTGTYFVSPLIKAKGRRSRSESPFAYIYSMAQSSINASEQNLLNQTFLRLARKDKTGLLGVNNKVWYVQTGLNEDGNPIHEIQSPVYSANPQQYIRNMEEFEERMRKLSESGMAFQRGSKLDTGGLFIKRNQASQHEIHVSENGTDYVVYINGNPAVARAVNGANVKHIPDELRFISSVGREMAANFTTRNPLFVASNFARDYTFTSSILPVKENLKYALRFQGNIPSAAGALQRYLRGKADLSKRYRIEVHYLFFIIAGGPEIFVSTNFINKFHENL
jgi:hypothetical protein